MQNLFQFAGGVVHGLGNCPSCTVYREWNDSLRIENEQLREILSERESQGKERKEEGEETRSFSPIKGRGTWRETREKLERKAARAARELREVEKKNEAVEPSIHDEILKEIN